MQLDQGRDRHLLGAAGSPKRSFPCWRCDTALFRAARWHAAPGSRAGGNYVLDARGVCGVLTTFGFGGSNCSLVIGAAAFEGIGLARSRAA